MEMRVQSPWKRIFKDESRRIETKTDEIRKNFEAQISKYRAK